MDVVVWFWRLVCVMHLFACWCFALLLETDVALLACLCVPACKACASPRVALARENEGLGIAWNSRAWFWKTGPQHLFDLSPV